MAEINLIPRDYSDWLAKQSLWKRYAMIFGAVNVAVILTGIGLAQLTGQVRAEVMQLKSANAITQQQQAQLEQLQEQHAEYTRQLGLLRGLRAGAAVDEIFGVIDRALTGRDLWFLDWDFRRAGVVVDGQERGIETGYFVIVDEENSGRGQDWQVQTHMTVHGQARDHQALSSFVRALFEQDEIRDVSVQKTSATDYGDGRVVEFDMTIVLNSAVREI